MSLRNYLRGGLALGDNIRTPTMNRFIDFYQKHTKTITQSRLADERDEMKRVRGMYDVTYGFQDIVWIIKKAIMGDVMNDVVLQDKQVQEIDLALEKIMKNDSSSSSKKSKSESESKSEADDEDEDDGDYDGNEWND